VAGTASDAGKTVVVAGICRALARRGVKVAPFKAQNMALNSAVTADGAEIGRAQAVQAAAAGVEPEAAMNPVLLKPTGEHQSQVVVMGRAHGVVGALGYPQRRPGLGRIAAAALEDLRSRFDVVICEGAGSPAEINLRRHDIANMGLARTAGLPTLVVADIDRGGALAALYGTLAVLEPDDQRLIAGFVINKFRGDRRLLQPGLEQLQALTGRPTLGVLPFLSDLELDAEDSLGLDIPRAGLPATAGDVLDVAVVRVRRAANVTDLDPLGCEPGVCVRITDRPAQIAAADLVVLPGSKATVADLAFLRERGIDRVLLDRARRGRPILGICGGYQQLGTAIDDPVESGAGEVAGLGLLPATTVFHPDKVLDRPAGTSPPLGGVAVSGYQIRHGRVRVHGGEPLIRTTAGAAEGCRSGAVLGTSWHGVLESDDFRRALLTWVAAASGRDWRPGTAAFADVREARLDRLGDLVTDHLDGDALDALIRGGPPRDLPTLSATLTGTLA